MFEKICVYCHNKSYSASEKGKWCCPICGKDISGVKTEQEKKRKGKVIKKVR